MPIQHFQYDRVDQNLGRCIPCSIPNSLSGKVNHMFSYRYHIRCRSRTLCSYFRCKTVYQQLQLSFLCFYFQAFALPQLHATRAVSEHFVPIITCITAGAGAIIRSFGPDSMGGRGDFGARIDAEAARTGLLADEIGNEVLYLPYHISRDTDQCSIQRYLAIQKENLSKFLVFLQCMTTNFTRRRYDVFDLIQPFLTNLSRFPLKQAFITS